MASFEAMEANLRAMLAVFAHANRWGEAREYAGLAVAASGVNFSMFNSAILTAPVAAAAELDERIATAAAHFGMRGLPWSFWLCRSWLEPALWNRTVETFSRRGLHLVVELPGMEAKRLSPPARPLPPLVYRRVTDAQRRADFNHVMAVAFGIPFVISREVYESERTWNGEITGWVGYADGLPVTTAATVPAGGVVGLYAVGTLPSWQRKGFGEAVVRHALGEAQAQSGLERSVLQASDAGLRLYERMGYWTVTRYAVFAYR